jgi:hypothetical protein
MPVKKRGVERRMEIKIAREDIAYDGSQLSSHFALKKFGLRGDSLVVFQGPMNVENDHMADLEDLLAQATIRSARMLHFVAEFFAVSLENTVLRQRLLARLAADIVTEHSGRTIQVRGDDLYGEGRKLSVSIAAPSPVSCLIHFGLNISTKDVPVDAIGLEELGIDPIRLGQELAQAFRQELQDVHWALSKVRGVP